MGRVATALMSDLCEYFWQQKETSGRTKTIYTLITRNKWQQSLSCGSSKDSRYFFALAKRRRHSKKLSPLWCALEKWVIPLYLPKQITSSIITVKWWVMRGKLCLQPFLGCLTFQRWKERCAWNALILIKSITAQVPTFQTMIHGWWRLCCGGCGSKKEPLIGT